MSNTERTLKDWRYGQTQAERLCAALLHIEGYSDVDPQHPLGGPDGIKDVLVKRNNWTWIAAAFFPPTEQSFSEIKKKFTDDFKGVGKNKASGFAFFVNQYLKVSEREELQEIAGPISLELYHLERVRSLLDSPKGCGARLEYLRIPMTEEEQLTFWSAMNYDVTRKLIENEGQFSQINKKLDEVLKRTNSLEGNTGPSSLQQSLDNVVLAENPTAALSLSMLAWLHRIVTEDDNLPEAVRGRFRSVQVWLGPANSEQVRASYMPPPPEEVIKLMTEFLNWWRSTQPNAHGQDKVAIISILTQFHHKFLQIHPFLDGNGRVARLLLDQAARELLNMKVGRELTENPARYFESLHSADKGDFGPLHAIILASLQ